MSKKEKGAARDHALAKKAEPLEILAPKVPRIDVGHAREYIKALTGSPDTPMTYQTFTDSWKARKGFRESGRSDPLVRILHGTRTRVFPELARLNAAGAGIFICVNETDLKGRQAKNIVSLRAAFTDCDQDRPQRDSPLAASFLVHSSSRRHWHRYWLLREGEDLERFSSLQRHLAEYYDSDPNVAALSQAMRLPGFLHRKDVPIFVELWLGGPRKYTIDELLEAHPLSRAKLPRPSYSTEMASAPARSAKGEALKRAAAYIAKIPPAVEGNGGDHATFVAACRMLRDFGLTIDDAMPLLRGWNAKNLPPWSEAELREKIENAARYGTGPIREKLLCGGLALLPASSDPALPDSRLPEDWLSPAAVLRPHSGDMRRFPTALPSIDAHTRGGLPLGKVVTITGAPGTGKTALAIQLGMEAVLNGGVALLGLFPDEGREAAAIRIGQNLGFDRQKLEERDPTAIAKFAKAVANLAVFLPDPDEVGNTLEAAVTRVRHAVFSGHVLVVIIDSTQTANRDAGREEENPRLRIEALMDSLKRESRRFPALILNVSQVSRASYQHRKPEDNVIALAAGAESRSIEFASDMKLDLSGDPETVVWLYASKNRLGDSTKFKVPLKFDFEAARFRETTLAEARQREADNRNRQKREQIEAGKEQIVRILSKEQDGLGTNALRGRVGGRHEFCDLAVRELEKAGVVRNISQKPKHFRWVLAEE
jgi:KaiC/GvpD/RAD55 family RecA-like ATPase